MAHKNPMPSDDDFLRLLQFLDRPWAGYRKVRKGVKKRVRRHMADLNCTSIEDYLEIIQQRCDEKRRCEEALIVNISRFFRDQGLWKELERRILPDLIRRYVPPIRIWSAGCARGEEAYSLAMVWRQLPSPPQLILLATDISAASLSRAQQGIYNQSSLKEVSADLERLFFLSHGRHQKIIRTRQITPINWLRYDLFDPPPWGPFHMILLRNNLLTYYQGAKLISALRQILARMAQGGFLVVGAHERLPDIDISLERDPSCPYVYKLQ